MCRASYVSDDVLAVCSIIHVCNYCTPHYGSGALSLWPHLISLFPSLQQERKGKRMTVRASITIINAPGSLLVSSVQVQGEGVRRPLSFSLPPRPARIRIYAVRDRDIPRTATLQGYYIKHKTRPAGQSNPTKPTGRHAQGVLCMCVQRKCGQGRGGNRQGERTPGSLHAWLFLSHALLRSHSPLSVGLSLSISGPLSQALGSTARTTL